jgi:hypothetical protein
MRVAAVTDEREKRLMKYQVVTCSLACRIRSRNGRKEAWKSVTQYKGVNHSISSVCHQQQHLHRHFIGGNSVIEIKRAGGVTIKLLSMQF